MSPSLVCRRETIAWPGSAAVTLLPPSLTVFILEYLLWILSSTRDRSHSARFEQLRRHRRLSGIRSDGSSREKVEQRFVHHVGMRPQHAVGRGLDGHELASLDQLVREHARRGDRQDPVCGAVHDQRGHTDLGQVLAEVRQPDGRALVGAFRRSSGADIPAVTHCLLANPIAEEAVEVVEVLIEPGQESEPILFYRGLDSYYAGLVEPPLGMVLAFQKVRRYSGQDGYFADSVQAVGAPIAGDLPGRH